MLLAAEIISVLGTLIIAFPSGSLLSASSSSRLHVYPTMTLAAWSIGFFLFGVYFNRHPHAGHQRHHHVITDIVAFPEVFKFVAYILSALTWACILREKFVLSRAKSSAVDYAKWVGAPLGFVVTYLFLTSWVNQFFSWPSKYLRTMGFLGILGSLIYAAGNAMLVNRGVSIDRDMFVFQTLGFLMYSVNTTLMYKNPDWYAVTAIAIFLFANIALLASLLFTRKSHSYEQLREDAIEMPDLPTSRPRSRVQQEEY